MGRTTTARVVLDWRLLGALREREIPLAAERSIGLPSPPITNYLLICTLMQTNALTLLEMKVQVLEMSKAVQSWSASR